MILKIVFDEEEEFFGWKFRYSTPRRLPGWDWCPRKKGTYYYDGDALPRFLHCIMDGYFRFYEKPEFIFPNEIEEQTTTKIAFYDSRKFIDYQSGSTNVSWNRLVRDLTNMYGRAICEYENDVSQPFDNHEETLYRLSNWYMR